VNLKKNRYKKSNHSRKQMLKEVKSLNNLVNIELLTLSRAFVLTTYLEIGQICLPLTNFFKTRNVEELKCCVFISH